MVDLKKKRKKKIDKEHGLGEWLSEDKCKY